MTLVDQSLSERLEAYCRDMGCPCLSVLAPVHAMLQSYLGAVSTPRAGAQHMLNADYFRRIDALNFTMLHDDGQLSDNLEEADVVLVGISRTSKTPTSIYLANRGIKTANIPLVPGVPLPPQLEMLVRPLVVGLVASPDRIVQIRQNRLLSLNASTDSDYVDKDLVADEMSNARKLFARHDWPVIDVTRRSIEEAAATIIEWYHARRATLVAQ
jgi:[pyruvate, water dikinase]-phosphate phosphotransferase / [pyruvate, water dikinase] kinase